MNTHKIKTEIDYDSFEDEYEREYAMKYVENAYNVFSKSELQKATNKHEYFSTSVKTIDRLMKGFEKTVPEAYLIAGLRGHGVTSLAMQFTKALIRQGETVLYLAYEDGKAMTAERMILSAANVTLKDFKRQELDDEELDSIAKECKRFEQEFCFLSDSINDFKDISSAIRETRARFLVVDSLYGLPGDEVEAFKQLALLCRRLKVTLIATYRFDRHCFDEETQPSLMHYYSQLEKTFGSGIVKLANVIFVCRKFDEYFDSIDDPRWDIRTIELVSNGGKSCTGISEVMQDKYLNIVDIPKNIIDEYDLMVF